MASISGKHLGDSDAEQVINSLVEKEIDDSIYTLNFSSSVSLES